MNPQVSCAVQDAGFSGILNGIEVIPAVAGPGQPSERCVINDQPVPRVTVTGEGSAGRLADRFACQPGAVNSRLSAVLNTGGEEFIIIEQWTSGGTVSFIADAARWHPLYLGDLRGVYADPGRAEEVFDRGCFAAVHDPTLETLTTVSSTRSGATNCVDLLRVVVAQRR